MFLLKTDSTSNADRYAADEHDLRTPLTVVRAVAEILRDHADLPALDRRRLLDALVEESERLSQAIERILGETSPTAGSSMRSIESGSSAQLNEAGE